MPEEQLRYLAAKRSVDRRALDRRVRAHFLEGLERLSKDRTSSVRLLDLGCGIGSTVDHLLAWGLPVGRFSMHLVDHDPTLVSHCRERLGDVVTEEGFEVIDTDPLVADDGSTVIDIEVSCDDAMNMLEHEQHEVITAMGFIDLLDSQGIDRFASLLNGTELAYLPITYDGGTWFAPPIDSDESLWLNERYHRHMRTRERPGTPRAGRTLLATLDRSQRTLVGSSDWVVTPEGGCYPHDEAFFLHHIIDTVTGALEEEGSMKESHLTTWAETRHRQVTEGELIYVAHQLDILRCPPVL